jgi:AraC-like DNA-binding protein
MDKITERERRIYGKDVGGVERQADYSIFRFANSGGSAEMINHSIFRGMELNMCNSFIDRMRGYVCPRGNILVINYCKTGWVDLEMRGKSRSMSAGDIFICRKGDEHPDSIFPYNNYCGLSIEVNIDQLSSGLVTVFNEFQVDLETFVSRYDSLEGKCLQADAATQRVFGELLCLGSPPNMRDKGYIRFKAIEAIKLLNNYRDNENGLESRNVLYRQTQDISEVADFLRENLQEHYTIDELASKYGLSQTVLKRKFKEMYGIPIYSFARKCKMDKAANLLQQTDLKVIDVAGMVGYDNSSKFSEAFRLYMGSLPTEFRKTSAEAIF